MIKHKVLVVDDEESPRRTLARMLEDEGLDVVTAADGEEALEMIRRERPDLVLLDVMMPKLNGFETCHRLKGDPEHRLTPVIFMTSSTALENRLRGLEMGVDDFLPKPCDRAELSARVRSMLRLKRYTDELEGAEAVLLAMARSIEGKDPYMQGHCDRLAIYCQKLGRRLGCTRSEVRALRQAGVVHDIGKISIPDAILLKPGPLTVAETTILREHPVTGEEICRGLGSFKEVLPIIRHHHERLDGTGYPDGLKGAEIPRTARILQVVDVYDALMTERSYKKAFSRSRSLEILRAETERGWWDLEVVHAFLQLLDEDDPELLSLESTLAGIVDDDRR